MSRLLAATPQVFVGDTSLLADAGAESAASRLAARGLSRVLWLGAAEGAASDLAGLPCDFADLGGGTGGSSTGASPERLAAAARALEAALRAAPGVLLANDTEPGDSTEDEEDRCAGIRIRVRVSRAEADKSWGVKWHKNIFKQSQRLVVDEIAKNSILSAWNERQPHNLQLGYGDRLLRINGVSADEKPGSKASALMRAELQTEEMRAMFFRPGKAPKKAPKPDIAPGAVLLCVNSESELAVAAAVAGAHRWLFRPKDYEEDVDAIVDELREVAALLREPASQPWLEALSAVRGVDLAALPAGPRLASPQVGGDSRSEAPAHAAQEGRSSVDQVTETIAACAPAVVSAEVAVAAASGGEVDGTLAEDAAAGLAAEVAVVGGADAEVGEEATEEAVEDRTPAWVYSCRKCGTALFHDLNILPHFSEGKTKRSRHWLPAEAAEGEEASQTCTSVFVEPMKWMGETQDQVGKLACGNERCKQKLGGFSWHGLPCSCGQWQSPAFQIHCARLDCMPAAGRRVRGGPPQAVFKE
mmetsp:Transcript_97943/g.255554  ORF Transcript_97943/g.255554 Transcript_97943/m.255554 type:complete len:530 (+) Transcript_97943:71-1660(+)